MSGFPVPLGPVGYPLPAYTDLGGYPLATAEQQAAGYPFTLLVYGGGKLVAQWAKRPNVVHVGHRASVRKRPGQGSRAKQSRNTI